MSYSQEDIIKKTDGLIDYKELNRLIELDLNTIAETYLSTLEGYPENMIQFEVFDDFGTFNKYIELQGPGIGQQTPITPVLISNLGGSFNNEKGPEVYMLNFEMQAYGFEDDHLNLRNIFTIYAEIKHGKTEYLESITGEDGGSASYYHMLPAFGVPVSDGGVRRITLFQNYGMTIVKEGKLFNQAVFTYDGHELDVLAFNVQKSKQTGSGQKNSQAFIGTQAESQTIVVSLNMISDDSRGSRLLSEDIRKYHVGLNQKREISITYPGEAPDSYTVILTDGGIQGTAGGYFTINATFNLAFQDR